MPCGHRLVAVLASPEKLSLSSRFLADFVVIGVSFCQGKLELVVDEFLGLIAIVSGDFRPSEQPRVNFTRHRR